MYLGVPSTPWKTPINSFCFRWMRLLSWLIHTSPASVVVLTCQGKVTLMYLKRQVTWCDLTATFGIWQLPMSTHTTLVLGGDLSLADNSLVESWLILDLHFPKQTRLLYADIKMRIPGFPSIQARISLPSNLHFLPCCFHAYILSRYTALHINSVDLTTSKDFHDEKVSSSR